MWPNPQFPAYLVAFTEEIFMWNLSFWAVQSDIILTKCSSYIDELTLLVKVLTL